MLTEAKLRKRVYEATFKRGSSLFNAGGVLEMEEEDQGDRMLIRAKVQGSGNFRILWKLILPGVISPLTVQASYIFSQAIISEASLSFLGAGVPAPAASWGNMLEASKAVLSKAPWTMIVPGAAVIICVLSLNLFGDGLRDFMDPRTKGGVKK